jgi:predicted metal-binding protein
LKSQATKWTTGALFICDQCSKSFLPGEVKESGAPAENLKKFLKSQLKSQDLGGQIRVMTSSCLDLCEDNRQALCYLSTSGTDVESFTVHPESDREQILDFLKGKGLIPGT